MKRGAIGIDVGGTKTLCLLVDEDYKILECLKFKTAASEGERNFLNELMNAVRKLQKLSHKKKLVLVGAGVACAGQVDCDKLEIRSSPNLLRLEGCEIGAYLERELQVRAYLRNDVQMGIYGEHLLGAARGAANALGIFFGTGVGSAAIINGHLYHGASGFGGQVGALLAQPVGGPKAALSHGIVDRIASKAAIAGEALVMAVKEWAPYLHRKVGADLSKVTWGTLKRSIEHGDKKVEEMLRARMRVVGIATSNVVNFLNPELVVLGGGLIHAFPKLAQKEFEAGLRQHLVPEVGDALKVKLAELGKQAAALGASCVALGGAPETAALREAA
ncbi:MAG TPA: ROK family protein [Patescibacteria group bacterium]|jgi:glucokinase|nr:ROK family protein [Patescibacteria group bacterium]